MRSNVHLAVLLLACYALRPAIAAENIVADESSVEAAFLYNFALFTEWPDLPANEFSICVMANGPVLKALEPFMKKQVKDRPVRAIGISDASNILSCQILFIGESKHGDIGNLARQIGKAPVLVVSEENSYDPKNVIISLVIQQKRIGFKINLSSARANSLTLSSKLLKLAQQIY